MPGYRKLIAGVAATLVTWVLTHKLGVDLSTSPLDSGYSWAQIIPFAAGYFAVWAVRELHLEDIDPEGEANKNEPPPEVDGEQEV